jgi:hypothetical protein
MPMVGFWPLILMKHHCSAGSTHIERNSKLNPFGIERLYIRTFNLSNRRHWSFIFTHASTSSRCILFAIRYLQLGDSFEMPSEVEWIVNEMVGWLKVRDPVLIKEIFCKPDNWADPNGGSSTAGSAGRVDGRCTQEN